jgi:hypothetical protein
MSAHKSHLSDEQKITLLCALQKIDRSIFAKLASNDLDFLYSIFVSMPFEDRTKVEVIEERLIRALAELRAVARDETQCTIGNSPTLCELVEHLKATVFSLGCRCEK